MSFCLANPANLPKKRIASRPTINPIPSIIWSRDQAKNTKNTIQVMWLQHEAMTSIRPGWWPNWVVPWLKTALQQSMRPAFWAHTFPASMHKFCRALLTSTMPTALRRTSKKSRPPIRYECWKQPVRHIQFTGLYRTFNDFTNNKRVFPMSREFNTFLQCFGSFAFHSSESESGVKRRPTTAAAAKQTAPAESEEIEEIYGSSPKQNLVRTQRRPAISSNNFKNRFRAVNGRPKEEAEYTDLTSSSSVESVTPPINSPAYKKPRTSNKPPKR